MAYSWLQQPNESYSDVMRRLEKIFPNLGLHETTLDRFWDKESQTVFQYGDFYGISTAEAIIAVLIKKYGIAESKIQEVYRGKPSNLIDDELNQKMNEALDACSNYDAASNSNKLQYVNDNPQLYHDKIIQGDKLLIERKYREAIEYYCDLLKEIRVFQTHVVYHFCKALICASELFIAYRFLLGATTALYTQYGILKSFHSSLCAELINACRSLVHSQNIGTYRAFVEAIVGNLQYPEWKYTEPISREKLLSEARTVYENAVKAGLGPR